MRPTGWEPVEDLDQGAGLTTVDSNGWRPDSPALRARLALLARAKEGRPEETERCEGLDDPKLDRLLPDHAVSQLREEVDARSAIRRRFDHRAKELRIGWADHLVDCP